jgi:hypothetical protein
MKKVLYIILSLLLCVGAVGGTVALAKHLTDKAENPPPVEETTDDTTDTSKIQLKEGETLLTDPADFRVNKWYRFYIDESNPTSEAYIVLNLVRGDGGFDGGYTEDGSTIEVDMPKVKIGISTAFTETGYIYWNDTMRLSVDAEVGGGENYFEIYLDENVFTGMGSKEGEPSIWFELTRDTECLEVGNKGGGYVVVLDDEQSNGNSGGTVVEEEATSTLVAPANESALICDGLEMVQGAQLYLGTDTDRPALRFTCNVSADLKATVEADSTKKLAMLVIPMKFFDRVNTNNYTYIDWVNAFNDAGIDSYYLSEFETTQLYENGSNYYMRYRLEGIPYGGMNMEVTCLGVLIDNSGATPTYTYSKLPNGATYRSNSRSVAYVASATLNAYKLGLESLDDAALAKMQGYVNEAVDSANGLTEATADGSTFEITTNATTKTMSVGETFQVNASYAPSNVLVPIWYRSNDTSIVTVDDNGLIKAVGKGTAVVGIYVAGEVVAITITVA